LANARDVICPSIYIGRAPSELRIQAFRRVLLYALIVSYIILSVIFSYVQYVETFHTLVFIGTEIINTFMLTKYFSLDTSCSI